MWVGRPWAGSLTTLLHVTSQGPNITALATKAISPDPHWENKSMLGALGSVECAVGQEGQIWLERSGATWNPPALLSSHPLPKADVSPDAASFPDLQGAAGTALH